jgi:hypothetical protein
MRTYQHTAFTILVGYDILNGEHKSDAGVGSGRRRRFVIDMDFDYPQRYESCTQPPIQWDPGALCLGK